MNKRTLISSGTAIVALLLVLCTFNISTAHAQVQRMHTALRPNVTCSGNGCNGQSATGSGCSASQQIAGGGAAYAELFDGGTFYGTVYLMWSTTCHTNWNETDMASGKCGSVRGYVQRQSGPDGGSLSETFASTGCILRSLMVYANQEFSRASSTIVFNNRTDTATTGWY